MTRTQLNLFETKYDVIDQSVHPQFWAYQAGMADGDGSFQMKRKGKCVQGSSGDVVRQKRKVVDEMDGHEKERSKVTKNANLKILISTIFFPTQINRKLLNKVAEA